MSVPGSGSSGGGRLDFALVVFPLTAVFDLALRVVARFAVGLDGPM